MFFLRKSKVVIDALTISPPAYNYFPIARANEYLPSWWKDVPKYPETPDPKHQRLEIKGNTIRRCAGVIDYYKNDNIIIPLWSDFKLKYGPQEYEYMFADGESELVTHDQSLRGPTFLSDFLHFKIASPWKFIEKSGIKFHFSQPFYNFNDPRNVLIPPAIVNYKYQHSTEINFLVRRPACDKIMELEAGTPMVHLTPLTDKYVEVRHHLVDKTEFYKKTSWLFAFNNAYQRAKRIQDKRESKCPFGFGN